MEKDEVAKLRDDLQRLAAVVANLVRDKRRHNALPFTGDADPWEADLATAEGIEGEVTTTPKA